MSCQNKNVSYERYAAPPRTAYDQLMNNMYNPVGNNQYYAAPFPIPRTHFDTVMQQKLCPSCGKGYYDENPDSAYGPYK